MNATTICLKLLQFTAILLLSLPFQSHASINIVACFQTSDGSQELTPAEEALIPLAMQNALPNGIISKQDCILVNTVSYNATQTLNIGGSTGGTGAGRVTFEPFSINKRVDALSPFLFLQMSEGTPYRQINFFFLSDAANATFQTRMIVQLGLAAIQSIRVSASTGGNLINELVQIEYGGIQTSVYLQTATGGLTNSITSGWNRVRNIALPGGSFAPGALPTMPNILQ
jgi:type VI protein secretion system component Hcp